ncbi:MAG: hypothetical protein K0S37_2493 [Microbacterium sp.]|nr:hypothetical protein [Microbacterium sp.]
MNRLRTVTHAYRMPGGWEKVEKQALTPDHAETLRAAGYTLVRARRGWGDTRELSLSHYLARTGRAGDPSVA